MGGWARLGVIGAVIWWAGASGWMVLGHHPPSKDDAIFWPHRCEPGDEKYMSPSEFEQRVEGANSVLYEMYISRACREPEVVQQAAREDRRLKFQAAQLGEGLMWAGIVVAPLLAWAVIAILAKLIGWVGQGFRKPDPAP